MSELISQLTARKQRLQRFAEAACQYSDRQRQRDDERQAKALERYLAIKAAEAKPKPEPEPKPAVEGFIPSQVVTIQRIVAARFDLRRTDLTSASRLGKFVLARQIAVYLCRKTTKLSFPYIAGKFGGRDHTTALHSFKKVGDMIVADEKFAAMVQSIEDEIARDLARFDQIKAAVQA